MRTVFVWEYLCSGAVENPQSHGAMFEEGRAMLFALLEDISRCGRFELVTTCEPSLKSEFDQLEINARILPACSAVDEIALFSQLAEASDFTFVIAPETKDVLLFRHNLVDQSNGRFVGCHKVAIEICGDKWRTHLQLQKTGIPLIPTMLYSPNIIIEDLIYPVVCKPRDGAGCCKTYLVHNTTELRALIACGSLILENTILQPFVKGTGFSVAALFEQSELAELLSPVRHCTTYEKTISCSVMEIDREFRVPSTVREIVEIAGKTISGFDGYVGFDFILSAGIHSQPTLIEINPRLTTSYLEYRKSKSVNLAERMLGTVLRYPDANNHRSRSSE